MLPKGSPELLLTWFARYGLLVLAALGALLLVVAELSTLYEVVAITARIPGSSQSAGGHHFYALLLLALVSLPMAFGAVVGGSRPAAFALLGLGVVALFICLAIDLPDVGDEGLLAESYESAKATPRAGFYLEILGSLVVIGAGVGTLLLRPAEGAGATTSSSSEPVASTPEPSPS